MWLCWVLLAFWLYFLSVLWRGSDDAVVFLIWAGIFACVIGNHVFSQMVHAHLSRMPRAEWANLLVGLVMIGMSCVVLPTAVVSLAGATAWGVLCVFMAAAGLGLLSATWRTQAFWGVCIGIGLLFGLKWLVPDWPEQLSLAASGNAPGTSMIVGLVGLGLFAAAVYRLLHLKNWNATFIVQKPSGYWELKHGDAAPWSRQSPWTTWWTWIEHHAGIARLRGPVPPTLFARARLWQLGLGLRGRWFVGLLMLVFLAGVNVILWLFAWKCAETYAENIANAVVLLVVISHIVPAVALTAFSEHKGCLAAESLRPTDRRRFVLEVGLAVGLTWLQACLATLAIVGLAVWLLQPELLESAKAAGYVLRFVSIQVLVLGLFAFWDTLQSIWTRFLCGVVGFIVAIPLLASVIIQNVVSIPSLVLNAAMIVVGSVLVVAASRRWREMELGYLECGD